MTAQVSPDNIAEWYGFVYDKAAEGWAGEDPFNHPDLCGFAAASVAKSIAENIVECGERYSWSEAHSDVMDAARKPFTDCKDCYCGRYLEVDGLAMNGALLNNVEADPSTIYRAYCDEHAPGLADRLLMLVTNHDEDLSAQGAELHLSLMPSEADRWYDRLIGFMIPAIRRPLDG